ncbi:MAG: type I DNA topoisomerase, partial [Clostridia bacterium]|nr:type I DNA topoisomerase [Clostridia bacterium]
VEKTRRITFNEVTKTAVKEAIKNPRTVDMALVNSQQARRMLDRIVGYKLSPFLWKTIRGGLSAGRVQSVATRIIVEREREIEAFIPREYWTLSAEHKNSEGTSFLSRFYGTAEKKIDLHTEDDVNAVKAALEGKPFVIDSIKKSLRRKNPHAPFTTSSLLQESARKLNFQSHKTMKIAQELYEGISLGAENGGVRGLITYMRTDSLRISAEAQTAARNYIIENYGEDYYPETPRVYKTKGDAQDAHEAIRPSDITLDPTRIRKKLTNDQYKLYKLIWERFLASQMQAASYDTVNASILCDRYLFKASGQTLRFKGYLAVYTEVAGEEEDTANPLPTLEEGELLKDSLLLSEQHFTEPPARYTEAALIDFFKEMGIGRPSTYAQIITTITTRGYVKREGKSIVPTALGVTTTDLMIEFFPDIVDYAFTAQMENDLDAVSSGNNTVVEVLGKFYSKFKFDLDAAFDSVDNGSVTVEAETTDIVCDKCGAKMIIKSGRFGKFAACPNYPTCKNTRSLTENTTEEEKAPTETTDLTCEKCGSPMVVRNGKYGKFFACSAFPSCRHIVGTDNTIGVPCPICQKDIVMKRAKSKTVFYSCSGYPECSFSSWDKPTRETCAVCGKMLFVKKGKEHPVCCDKSCAAFGKEVIKE